MPDYRKKSNILKGILSLLMIGSAITAGACGKENAAVSFSLEGAALSEPSAGQAEQAETKDGGAALSGGDSGMAAASAAGEDASAAASGAAGTSAGDSAAEAALSSGKNGASGAAAAGDGAAADASGAVSDAAAGTIVVHICGAVKAPGVYELPGGSRVMDAVAAGGGFLEEADQSACNLAEKVTDGCQIYIMTREESSLAAQPLAAGIQPASAGASAGGEAGAQSGATADTGGGADGKVDLNTADAAALKTLPGIGDSRAAAILAWREENGRFTCIEDIMKVSGIKQGAFDKIKDLITAGTG